MTDCTERDEEPVVRLLAHAGLAAETDMRRLDVHLRGAGNAFVRAHVALMCLRPPPGRALCRARDFADQTHGQNGISSSSRSSTGAIYPWSPGRRRWLSAPALPPSLGLSSITSLASKPASAIS